MRINNSTYKYFTAIYACLFYMHYSLKAGNFVFTNIPFLFFGTLFSYHFLQRNIINRLLIALTALSSIFLPWNMLFQYSIICIITLLYPKYLRPNLFLKPISISLSWCLLFRSQEVVHHIEAFFLIMALSLPFDLRDKNEDTKIKTLAHIFETRSFQVLCLIIWTFFIASRLYIDELESVKYTLLILSIYYCCILFLVKKGANRFRTYILLDSTIALQFALTYL